MAGTNRGGKRAAETNRRKYGPDFYKIIGAAGGSALTFHPKGFAADRERASRAGRIGGLKSKRRPKARVE